jgi:hypothetical protein
MSQFESAIGPLWSNWGLRTWNLLLARDEIIAQRYSTWETWKLAIRLHVGVPADPGGTWRENPGSAPLHDGRGFRHYVVSELRSIIVTVSPGGNHVSLSTANGQYDRYEIQQRPLTEHFKQVLQAMYPSLYRESGVPTTLVGRLLKL